MGIYEICNANGGYLQMITSRKTSLGQALAHGIRHSQNVRDFCGHSTAVEFDVTKDTRNQFTIESKDNVPTSITISHLKWIEPNVNRVYVD
jgi:hypothetical protein